MAHINLPDGLPGITGPLRQYPETGQHLSELAQALLRGPSSLTEAERELIATYVSSQNGCVFCMSSHGAAARSLLGPDAGLADQVKADFERAPISEKMKALLVIAGKVQQGGRRVSEADVARARAAGRTTRRSTTLSWSRRPSACTTVMWTGWRRSRRPTPPTTSAWAPPWPEAATSAARGRAS